jgi:quercetin dioxygenase-like cupin family protein
MGIQTPYRSGDAFGFYLSFATRGEGVALHQHSELHTHNITVQRGSVLVYGEAGPSGWSQTLSVGDVFNVAANTLHEITALEDDTLILNLNPHGMPAEYAGLPEEEFTGETLPPTFRPQP